MNKRTLLGSNILVFADSSLHKQYDDLQTANLMQASDSYVIYDPTGTKFALLGDFLKERGYRVVCAKLADLGHSGANYNPYHYAGYLAAKTRVTHALEEAGIPLSEHSDMPNDTLALDMLSMQPTALFCVTDPEAPETELLASLLIEQALRVTMSQLFPPCHTQFILGDCTALSQSTREYLAQRANDMYRKNISFLCRCPSPEHLQQIFGHESAAAFERSCAAVLYFADDSGRLAAAVKSAPLRAELMTLGTGDSYICSKGTKLSAACFSLKNHPSFRKAFAGKGKGGVNKL